MPEEKQKNNPRIAKLLGENSTVSSTAQAAESVELFS
jgi:hypothetical protein